MYFKAIPAFWVKPSPRKVSTYSCVWAAPHTVGFEEKKNTAPKHDRKSNVLVCGSITCVMCLPHFIHSAPPPNKGKIRKVMIPDLGKTQPYMSARVYADVQTYRITYGPIHIRICCESLANLLPDPCRKQCTFGFILFKFII